LVPVGDAADARCLPEQWRDKRTGRKCWQHGCELFVPSYWQQELVIVSRRRSQDYLALADCYCKSREYNHGNDYVGSGFSELPGNGEKIRLSHTACCYQHDKQ